QPAVQFQVPAEPSVKAALEQAARA
ncbi:MAG: hypothetical protein RIS90_1810, partial [Pseudomonadota bacterium]